MKTGNIRLRPMAEWRNQRVNPWWLLVALIIACLPVSDATAQQVRFAVQRGPYYVGEPMVVQITASGFEAGDEPICKLRGETPDGITIDGPRIGQSTSTFVQSINGKVTRRETVDYRFSFVVTASREGEYRVGPFELNYDGKSKAIQGTTIPFGKLDSDPNMQIELSLPSTSVYVGQEVPLTIRWAFAGEIDDVQYAYTNLQIRSPIFDQFSFDDRRPTSRTTLTLATAKGEIRVDAEVSKEKQSDREFIVVEGRRTLIADSIGRFDAIPVTCRTKRVTEWGRNFFGDLIARRNEPSLAAGEPVSFTVKPVPGNRPESFAGSVGGGFSIEVAANRTVVRVGDPISLDVTIRGDGSLEKTSLPSLAADGGLDPKLFQLPGEQPAGALSEDGRQKQFKVNIRVKDESVSQVPAIAFSWFDPVAEDFKTARSKPIALQVMPAQIVSAADVVATPKKGDSPAGNSAGAEVAVNSANSLTFIGANLAIEKDTSRLLVDTRGSFADQLFVAALYALGLVMAVAAIVIHRRRQIDPAFVERQTRIKQSKRTIAEAASKSSGEAAGEVAEALRRVLPDCDDEQRAEANRLIAECEVQIYKRSGADGSNIDQSVATRASQLIDQLLK